MNRNNGYKKILIIEDDEDSRFLLKYYLDEFNYNIIEATNGEDGIKKAEETLPDLILLDIMMPIMDGITALKIMRDKESLKDIPVIVLTAKNSDIEKQESIEAGCTNFIEKPIDLDLLLSTIKKYL